jgi:hypothetical protein
MRQITGAAIARWPTFRPRSLGPAGDQEDQDPSVWATTGSGSAQLRHRRRPVEGRGRAAHQDWRQGRDRPAAHGAAGFVGVGGAEDDRTFVLTAQTSSGVRLYELALRPDGKPKRPLVKIAVPPLPRHFGDCPAQLAGLAVSPDDRLVAVSILSNCPDGRAGQSEILTARIGSGHVLSTFRLGHGYPMWLSWTLAGSLVYSWSCTGVFVIPDATKEGSKTRLLLSDSASVGQFSGPDFPMVAPNGSAVFVTVRRGSDTLSIAKFQLGGGGKAVLTPPATNPARFCGPLWVDSQGHGLLAACGDTAEFEVQGNEGVLLPRPWILPTYPTPEAPAIAW